MYDRPPIPANSGNNPMLSKSANSLNNNDINRNRNRKNKQGYDDIQRRRSSVIEKRHKIEQYSQHLMHLTLCY